MTMRAFVCVSVVLVLGVASRAGELPGAAAIAAGHPNFPNGYELAAHFLCGSGRDNVESDGISISLIEGKQRAIADIGAPVKGEAFDTRRVEFKISGLEPAHEYVVGFTWFDSARKGRRQSVAFGLGGPAAWDVVLPSTSPLAFHGDEPTFARIQLPVPADAAAQGELLVAFANENGPDVVVNDMWILRKTDRQARKRVVTITGDDWTGHYWRATGPELAGALREDPRLEVCIVESPSVLASPLIAQYDAAIIHFKDYSNHVRLGSDVWNGLDRYVKDGHGVVVVHFGCGAFQEWDGYVHVAGRIWDPQKRGHDPYGPFRVRAIDVTHPIADGMTEFETSDELYTCLVGAPSIRVLFAATSVVDRQEYPMGFVVSGSAGRVFHSSLGHDVESLRHAGTRELYRRATAWAAGLPLDGR